MNRRSLVLLLLLVLCNCARDHVTVYAPAQLAGAAVFIDGRPAGQFQETQRQYRWLGWKKMKEELSAPPRSETIATLTDLTPGVHELRIEKAGYAPIVTSFSFAEGHIELEIDESQVLEDRIGATQ